MRSRPVPSSILPPSPGPVAPLRGKEIRIHPAADDADPAEAQCGKLITQLRSRYQTCLRAIVEPTQRAHDRLSQGLKPVVTAVLVELGVEAGDGR